MKAPPGPPDTVAIADAVRRGELSARRVLDCCLAALDDQKPMLNAFVFVDRGAARLAADAVDQAVRAGSDPGPLAGIPIGVKDLEDCAGMPTTTARSCTATPPRRRATRPTSPGCGPLGRFPSAGPPCRSSAWTPPRPAEPSASPATPTASTRRRAAAAEGRRPQWRPASSRWPPPATAAAPCGRPPPSAACRG